MFDICVADRIDGGLAFPTAPPTIAIVELFCTCFDILSPFLLSRREGFKSSPAISTEFILRHLLRRAISLFVFDVPVNVRASESKLQGLRFLGFVAYHGVNADFAAVEDVWHDLFLESWLVFRIRLRRRLAFF